MSTENKTNETHTMPVINASVLRLVLLTTRLISVRRRAHITRRSVVHVPRRRTLLPLLASPLSLHGMSLSVLRNHWLPPARRCDRSSASPLQMQRSMGNTYAPGWLRIDHWQIEHTQMCFDDIGTRGTKHSSNQVRDLADCTETKDG